MKSIYVIIISIVAASLAGGEVRAERSLDSLWPSRFKEGSNENHQGEALMVRLSMGVPVPGSGNGRVAVRGNCIDGLLARKYISYLHGRGVGIPYYVFKGKGDLVIGGTVTRGGWVTGTKIGKFELSLGQSTLLVGGARPPLGRITLTFTDGSVKTFVLPDSLAIADSPARIDGPLDGASIMMTLYSFYLEGGTIPLP